MYQQIGKAYRSRAEENTPRITVVSRMFEIAVEALDKAEAAAREGRIEDRHVAASRVNSILVVLRQHLDFDQGGEIAANLDRLYAFCMTQLVAFETRNDPEIAARVRELLLPLCEAWRQLAEEAVPDADEALPAPRSAISV